MSISTVFSTPSIVTLPPTKFGLPLCSFPWTPAVTTSVPSGVAGCTTAVYSAVTGVPFWSLRTTVIVVPLPLNCGSGVKCTVPSGSTVYVPSPGIVLVVVPSSNVAGTLSSIGTSTSSPLIVVLPGLNSGLPLCGAPWISSVNVLTPTGVTGLTVGV